MPERLTLLDRMADELDDIRDEALATQDRVEPTDEERRNGWTAESLTAYLADQRAGQELRIDPNSLQSRMAKRPNEQNHRYSPHRWRG